MDVMESTARKTVGKHKFKMEREQISPNRIRSSTNQDKPINPNDADTSITSSIIKTPSYITSLLHSHNSLRAFILGGLALLVMALSGPAWSQTQLGTDIDGKAADDASGYSVSLSSDGTRVAIGAPYNDDNGSNMGHVRVYEWNSGDWTQVGDDIDGGANGSTGYSVSLSSDGTWVAIGSPWSSGNVNKSGLVRVYNWDGNVWTQVGTDIDGELASDYSGWSVSLSSDGTRVAIGAIGTDANGSQSGQVRVYEYNSSGSDDWDQLGANIDGEEGGDWMGISVSLSSDGTRIATGATNHDGGSGHVRVYDYDGSVWTQVGADIDGEAASDQSGFSVSLSSDGTRVAIGAYGKDNANGSNSGHVRVYDWDGAAWAKLGADIDGEVAGDESGRSVSLSSDGTWVAIGAPGNNSGTGHVRVYKWDDNVWAQVGTDIDGEAAGDQNGSFYRGHRVSLSSDGARVAIGARGNDDNGSNSGHVRVYDYDGSAWTKVGADIDGKAADDKSGGTVSLSSDGTRVAIGAVGTDANGSNSGHVRVYSPITDSDFDGVGDNADVFPNDASESADTDSDGVGDNADVFPNDASESVDTDGDGVGDNGDDYNFAVTEKTDGSRRLTTIPASGSSNCSLATFSVDDNVATSKAGIAANGVGMAADFTLTGCNSTTAESLEVSIDLDAALPNGATVYKIKPDGEWLVIEGATIAGNVVTYTLLDNGPYDLNTALGEIRDPVTIAVSAVTPVPSLPFFGLLLLSGLLGVFGLHTLAVMPLLNEARKR